jgi:pilus assembly protein CpaB
VRFSTILMIGFAVVFGLLAVFLAQAWLNSQAEMRARSLDAQKKPIATRTLVVASKPLRFGTELTAQHLREMAWPQEGLPAGSFASIADLLSSGRRVALTAIEPNEPVLGTKITGANQRATLSAVLRDGLKAVTIRVNDVDGVGGFVLPGDHVDVVLTRQKDKDKASNDVVLQSVRVLAIDQSADERADKPSVVKAVTLEVDTTGAQKLALAASVGTLSLMLRKAGEAQSEFTRQITLSDLGNPSMPLAEKKVVKDPAETVEVTVTRKRESTPYQVPIEGTGGRDPASGGGRALRK